MSSASCQTHSYKAETEKLQGQIKTLQDGQNGRVKKAVRKAEKAWTTAIADRVRRLPVSWSSGHIASKIVDPNYVHPRGIAAFTPRIDEHGNVVRVDGEMVPAD